MITAQMLKTLTTATVQNLQQMLDRSGYSMQSFVGAEFLGITNGGEFCYKVIYPDEDGRGEISGKVFLEYVHTTGQVRASI